MTPSRPVTPWDEQDGRPPNVWDQQERDPKRERDFYDEFNTEEHIVQKASITLRPDAISLDYLTAVSPGPEAVGVANTAYTRPWQIRTEAGAVYLARGGAGVWEAEVLLFNFVGVPIIEIDCAFEQAGRPVVVASRASGVGGAHEVWIYFFDPTVGVFVFTNFGAGRTPRCLLDEALDAVISDVLVFYIADAVGASGTVCYRQQRDRYLTQYTTPAVGRGYLEGQQLPSIANLFLEDVTKARDSRVIVLLSARERGRYRFAHLTSTLYPFTLPEAESFDPSLAAIAGDLLVMVISVTPPGEGGPRYDDVEQMKASLTPQSGALVLPVILHTTFDIEEWKASLTPQSGAIAVVVITHSTFDVEEMKASLTPLAGSGSLAMIVIEHTTFDKEEWKATLTPQSGLLVVV